MKFRHSAASRVQRAWRIHRVLAARAQRDAEDATARRWRQEEVRARLDAREAEERVACELAVLHELKGGRRKRLAGAVDCR